MLCDTTSPSVRCKFPVETCKNFVYNPFPQFIVRVARFVRIVVFIVLAPASVPEGLQVLPISAFSAENQPIKFAANQG